MKEYVNPHINFKKIEICERIADKCWGNHTSGTVYFDYMSKKYEISLGSNCNNSAITGVKSGTVNIPTEEFYSILNSYNIDTKTLNTSNLLGYDPNLNS